MSCFHEKTHLRHGDHLWAFFRTACLVLWWFHPLVWAAAIVSRRDGELCCDEAVLRAVGPERGADYGRTLLTLAAEKSRPAAASCIAATLDGGGRQLKARIRAIARRAKPRKWAVVLAALLAAAAVGCAFSGAAADEADPSAGDGPAGVRHHARSGRRSAPGAFRGLWAMRNWRCPTA